MEITDEMTKELADYIASELFSAFKEKRIGAGSVNKISVIKINDGYGVRVESKGYKTEKPMPGMVYYKNRMSGYKAYKRKPKERTDEGTERYVTRKVMVCVNKSLSKWYANNDIEGSKEVKNDGKQ